MLPLALTLTWPETPITIVIVVVSALLLRLGLAVVIRRVVAASVRRSERHTSRARTGQVLSDVTGFGGERYRQRAEAVGSLLRSLATVVITVVAVLTVMSAIGLPLGPLLASAGIGGLAIGFGAQSLVKDLFAGIFMIIEDQFGVGDVVDTGEAIGTVEEVTLRITRLRDAQGVVWYVRNGEIIRVGNRSQGFSTATVDIPVASDEAPEKVIDLLTSVVAAVAAEDQFAEVLIEEPQVLGVESVVGSTMTIRVLAKTLTNQQFALQREIRERALTVLAANGVKRPPAFPQPPIS